MSERRLLAGLDIGGTKCAASLAVTATDRPEILGKVRFPTPDSPSTALEALGDGLEQLLAQNNRRGADLKAIGISCGGPLSSKRGLILSPPNLPGWDSIDPITPLRSRFGVPVSLQNDANAGALAEWSWGAGRGFENVIFLTFGTGMGAGLILDGRLYAGTNDMAGEIGHLRLAETGPIGFGKAGSFEGFCSGGGIAQLAKMRGFQGEPTAESVGKAAQSGDPIAIAVYMEVAEKLGRGLALLVDTLNPQRIILGSIFGRQRELIEPTMLESLRAESIGLNLGVCEIVSAGLGEMIGDYAALAVALNFG